MKRISFPFYYGWVIVAVSFLTLFFVLGTRFSFGIFYLAILKEYGWGRAETAGAFSLAMLCHAIFAPITGNLIDRFGPRRLFPVGGILLTAGLIAASRITSIWQMYLYIGVIMAVGINTISYAPHMSIIPKWFDKRKGLANGVVLSGFGVGTLFLAPTVEFIISRLGWRAAFLIIAAAILFIIVPITAIFHRRTPEEIGQSRAYEMKGTGGSRAFNRSMLEKGNGRPDGSGLWTLRAAFKTKAFWCVTGTAACQGYFISTLLVHQAAHMVDLGCSNILAASTVGFVSALGSAGGLFFGFLSDRIGREVAYSMGSSLAFLGIVSLLFADGNSSAWLLYAFVILYGLGQGTPGPIAAATSGDLFRGNSMGRIMSFQAVGYGIGGMVGPYLAGYFYDQRGSYSIAFVLQLFIIALGIFFIWTAAPRRKRSGHGM
ncbi:MFS transporter [Thermodesulfobacteriota bacterium]